jgi:hypothetical protein
LDTFVAFNNCTLSNYFFCSPNISEQLGKVHFPRFVQAAAPKYVGLFLFTPFHMEKDFKIAAQYVAVWIFFGLCAVLLLQAWGILPIK